MKTTVIAKAPIDVSAVRFPMLRAALEGFASAAEGVMVGWPIDDMKIYVTESGKSRVRCQVVVTGSEADLDVAYQLLKHWIFVGSK